MVRRFLARLLERRRQKARAKWLAWILVESNAIRDHLHVATDGFIWCRVCAYRSRQLWALLDRLEVK